MIATTKNLRIFVAVFTNKDMEISGYTVLLQLTYCPGERDWVNIILVTDDEQEARRELLLHAQAYAEQECLDQDFSNLPYEVAIVDDHGIPHSRFELHWLEKKKG